MLVGWSSSSLPRIFWLFAVQFGCLSYRNLLAACIHLLAYAGSVRCFKLLIEKIIIRPTAALAFGLYT